MFGKLMKKKSEHHKEVHVDKSAKDSSTHVKKKWNSADIILLGGLLAIMGGMFWIMSGSDDTQKESTKPVVVQDAVNSTKKPEQKAPFYEDTKPLDAKQNAPMVKEVKEEAPFVYANKADFSNENLMPPPEAYEQNNTLLAQKSPPLPKPNTPVEAPKGNEQKVVTTQELSIPKPQAMSPVQKPMPTVAPSTSYVCSILTMYRNMIGKEIMYYIKDETNHKYLPAHSQSNWDEAGILVKEKFIANRVDVDERMAEVSTGKWIPALEFMTCTLVQDGTL